LFKQIVQPDYEATSVASLSLPARAQKSRQMRRQETMIAATRTTNVDICVTKRVERIGTPRNKKGIFWQFIKTVYGLFPRNRHWQERALCAVKFGLRHSMQYQKSQKFYQWGVGI
jgi:hypothetical protein